MLNLIRCPRIFPVAVLLLLLTGLAACEREQAKSEKQHTQQSEPTTLEESASQGEALKNGDTAGEEPGLSEPDGPSSERPSPGTTVKAVMPEDGDNSGETVKSAPLPTEGSYASVVESEGRFQPIGISEGIQAALYEWTIKIKNDAGEGFLHGAIGECVGITLWEGDLSDQVGYCTITDKSGDQMYETFHMEGFVGEGSGHALGGTGKYKNIETEHKFWFEALDTTAADKVESESRRVGTFRFQE